MTIKEKFKCLDEVAVNCGDRYTKAQEWAATILLFSLGLIAFAAASVITGIIVHFMIKLGIFPFVLGSAIAGVGIWVYTQLKDVGCG